MYSTINALFSNDPYWPTAETKGQLSIYNSDCSYKIIKAIKSGSLSTFYPQPIKSNHCRLPPYPNNFGITFDGAR